MADEKLSALTALAEGPAETDEFYIRDVSEASSAESKRITAVEALNPEKFSAVTAVAGTDEVFVNDAGAGKKAAVADVVVAIPYIIPIIMEAPEGSNAYPDVHALATAAAKVTGIVLPEGGGIVSIFNWKCASPIPDTLPSTPVHTIRTTILTLATSTDEDIRITEHVLLTADGENLDTDPAAETEVTLRMPGGTETIDVYDEVVGATVAAGDFPSGQTARDSADALDNTGDVMVVNKCWIITGG